MSRPDASAFAFRPLAEADLPLLAEWLRRPHVAEWWSKGEPPRAIEELREDFLAHPRSSVRGYIACMSDEPIGFVQSYVAMGSGDGWWEDEDDPGVRGIDLFLADGDRLGQGLGSALVRAFVERLLADATITRIQTDPAPSNARAIRCYRKAGFRRVGIVETPDGPAVLMLALPADFVRLEAFRAERLAELVRMWRESFEHGVGIVDPHPIEEQERYLLAKVVPDHSIRVAFLGNEIVGFVAANPESIAQLYVRKGFHRRGIGTRLLDWAKARSRGSLWLHTFERNAVARAFYERHGFRIVARGHEPEWDLDDLRYEWAAGVKTRRASRAGG